MNHETAWLIEHPHDPRYGRESWYAGAKGFTIDSLEAIRFARREDALRIMDGLNPTLAKELRAEHHAWIPAPPACPRCDEAKVEAAELRMRLNHLRDSWKLIGETLREHGYDPKSEDQWVSMVHNALVELDLLKRAGKERDDQTNTIRGLVRAGALIAAEIDRRLRAVEEP